MLYPEVLVLPRITPDYAALEERRTIRKCKLPNTYRDGVKECRTSMRFPRVATTLLRRSGSTEPARPRMTCVRHLAQTQTSGHHNHPRSLGECGQPASVSIGTAMSMVNDVRTTRTLEANTTARSRDFVRGKLYAHLYLQHDLDCTNTHKRHHASLVLTNLWLTT